MNFRGMYRQWDHFRVLCITVEGVCIEEELLFKNPGYICLWGKWRVSL